MTAASQDIYNAMNQPGADGQGGGQQPGGNQNAGSENGQNAGTGETVTDAEFEEVK